MSDEVQGPSEIDIEKELRREWWMNHGHGIMALYGDDGEMQCGDCIADFKRQPIEELHALVQASRLQRWVEAEAQRG